MSNQNNLNNLFSNGLFQNTPNKDQQTPTQNIFNNTYQGNTPFQTNTFPNTANSNTFPSTFPNSNTFQNNTSSNPFGMSSSQTSATPFSLPAPSTSTSMTSTTSTPLFDNNRTQSWSTNTSVGNIFGQKSSSITPKNGTKDKQYEPQKIKEERGFGFLEYNHINSMKEYNEKSSDELRYEDYNLGRRPNPSSSTGFSTNMFGNTGQSTSTSLFGMNQPNTVKQEQSIFGQPTSSTTGFNLPTQQPFISTPSNTTPFPSGTTSLSSNTTSLPSGATSLPSGTTSLSSNTTSLQSNTTPFPSSTGSTPFGISNNPLGLSQPLQSDTTMMSNTSFQPSFAFNTNASTTNTIPMTQTLPFSTPQHTLSCADVDKSDPYGIKGMKFQFIEKELSPYQRLLAEPIHKVNEKIKIDKGLDFRPPEKENAYDVYFTPSLNEIRGMKKINNLVMTFPGKGQIEYLEPVDVSELNVENVTKKVLFTRDHVFVTDRPGKGLNLSARVSIDKIYPVCKSENKPIIGRASKYPEKGIQDRFVYTLKNNDMKEFVDYDFNKGTYVYKVQHF